MGGIGGCGCLLVSIQQLKFFSRRLHQALEDLDGIACNADDIVVIGNGDTEEEARMNHYKCLLALLRRCEEIGIKINSDKMQLRKKSIRFLGHLVTSEGLKPDPEKVEAIQIDERALKCHRTEKVFGVHTVPCKAPVKSSR